MLLEMRIKDFAIIDQSYIEFSNGLNVFTGETGTGKTLVVAAMNMLLGDRADTSLIRSGCEKASIQGLFSFHEEESAFKEIIDIDEEDMAIARDLLDSGKSKCYLNGNIVNVGRLSEIGEHLVDLHGQHEHQSLLKPLNHLLYLDAFGGGELLEIKEKYQNLYKDLYLKKKKLEELMCFQKESLQKQDMLRFQIDEIEKAELKPEEDIELERRKKILTHHEKLHLAVNSSIELIAGLDEAEFNSVDLLRKAESNLNNVRGIDEKLDKINDSLEPLVYTLEDFAHNLREYADAIEYDPCELENVEERLSVLSLLKKKYGESIVSIISYKDKAKEELNGLVDSSDSIPSLEQEIREKESILSDLATDLNKERAKWAEILEQKVQSYLSELNMPKVEFQVKLTQEQEEDGLEIEDKRLKAFNDGIDKAEFYIAPNPGEPPMPIRKIASGGELSRIMLALKIAFANIDKINTLIFDEVDSGIGGETAFSVGKKLAQLAINHQVICITHLPQIASFADRHYAISKTQKKDRTITSISILDKEKQLEEIARMLGGEKSTEVSRKHAAEIVTKAEDIKLRMRKGSYAPV